MASGFWVSEPMPCESAIGSRPSIASNAVISTVRKRSIAPRSTASRAVAPSSANCLKQLSITTPLSTAWPNSAMKPMAADTLNGMPVSKSAKIPPISANGTFIKMSSACFTDLKASKSSTKIRNTLTGTMIARRFMARCWFSNSPLHVTR